LTEIQTQQADQDAAKKRNPIEWLQKCLDDGTGKPHPNVAQFLTDEELRNIGQKVVREYDIDKNSRADWETTIEKATILARQLHEEKTTPWPGAASVKYPLITSAIIQFAARVYPEIIQGFEVVKAQIKGEDPDGQKEQRAQRVSQHMSWQCLSQMKGWEESMDKLLHVLPNAGTVFKKTYWDPINRLNRSDMLLPLDVVIHYKAKDMDTVRRITHVYPVYVNDIWERVKEGIWLDIKLPPEVDQDQPAEEDAAQDMLEQHRFLDLDGDGYQEPYVVTVHRASCQVVRIKARFEAEDVILTESGKEIKRIEPTQFFTKYGFIPSPDGSIYDIGFGTLLYALNAAINTVTNQLLDSGSLANLQGGFIDRSIRETGGAKPLKLGEFRKVKMGAGGRLQDRIMFAPTKEPSLVLFQLLGFLVEAGKEVSSIKDVITGTPPGANVPAATVLALIEQGLKTFSAITKRVYRALGAEFQKLYKLNGIYMEQEEVYRTLLDSQAAAYREDYRTGDLDILPVADPNMASDVVRVAKTQALFETISGRPNVDEDEITRRGIQMLQVPDPDKIIIPEEKRQQVPDPELMKVQLERDKFELEIMKWLTQEDEVLAKVEKLEAETVKILEEAEAVQPGLQVPVIQSWVKGYIEERKAEIQAKAAKQAGGKPGGSNTIRTA